MDSSSSFDTKYSVLESIGVGFYSEVFKVKSIAHGNSYFAAKKIPHKYLNCEDSTLLKEIDILKRITHPNIVSLLDYATSGDFVYLIMELAEGGDLFERIVSHGKFPEKDTKRITRELLDACAYLHSIDIVHRDLKPENVLFKTKDKNSPIMITDFGLSAVFLHRDMLKTSCGTPGYAAPEVLQRFPYNEKVDSWSIGVITYILMCGYPPFYNEEDSDVLLFQQVVSCNFSYHSPLWDTITEEAKLFINKLLIKDFQERLSCKDALNDPWLASAEGEDEFVGSSKPEVSEGQNPVNGAQSNGQLSAVPENLGERQNSGSQWQKAMDFMSAVENTFKSFGLT